MVNFLIIVQADNAQFQHSSGLGKCRTIADDVLIHGPRLPSETEPAHSKHGYNTDLDRYRRCYHTLRRSVDALMPSLTCLGVRSNSGHGTGHHRKNEASRTLTGPIGCRIAYNAADRT